MGLAKQGAEKMTLRKSPVLAMMAVALFLVPGCTLENGAQDARSASTNAQATPPTRTLAGDIERKDIFSVTEPGLWDGRPSLGGIWVAYPGLREPERVIIRNAATGKAVTGALFRRERLNPGPKIQVSSEAAGALGMLAGAPTTLSITALRAPEPATATVPTSPPDTAVQPQVSAAPVRADLPKSKPQAAPQPTAVPNKPYIQIGLFAVEANALRAAQAIRETGNPAVLKKGGSGDKPFWRVLVGPQKTPADNAKLLEFLRGLGFPDAYFVQN
mgnify:CR=1 FL=1